MCGMGGVGVGWWVWGRAVGMVLVADTVKQQLLACTQPAVRYLNLHVSLQ